MNQPFQTGPHRTTGSDGLSTDVSFPPTQLFPTRDPLPEPARRDLIDRLNRDLADTTFLLTHTKFAHWNVKGMAFWGLHDLFDELAAVLAVHIDHIAERVTALGGQAMGTAGMAVANCRLPAMPSDAVTGGEYVDLLAERLSFHDTNLYDDIDTATSYGEPDTADLLNEVSREVTQYLWFLEAHLQSLPNAGPSSGQGESTTRQEPSLQPPPGRGP